MWLAQIVDVVDSYGDEDPFSGDGFMVKGQRLLMDGISSLAVAAKQQFLMAMKEYRCV